MGIAINEAATFSDIPKFVPFGVLWYTQDTDDLYIGTGSSVGPAVTFIAGGGASGGSSVEVNGTSVSDPNFNGTTPAPPSGNTNVTWQVDGSGNVSAYAASGGLNIATAESPGVPSPLYSPSETPTGTNPYIFSEDVNGNWHTQAVMDTATANGGTGNGPADPAGTLTWTRRQYFRDSQTATQNGKNAFLSVNHVAQAGTLSTNQDRALWGSMGNPSGAIFNFSISSNVVTFGVTNPNASQYPWLPGQNISAAGLSVGTYLNGVALTIQSVSANSGNFNVTASSSSFTHANVSSTSDAGRLDLSMYSMEVQQMELDVQGAPAFNGEPDAECRTLSLQFNDNRTGTTTSSPAAGYGTLRATYSRFETSTGGNALTPWNVYLQMLNGSVTGTQGEAWVNLKIAYGDVSGGPAPQTSYTALEIDAATTSTFTRNNYGLVVQNWPTQARGTFNNWAALFGTGEIYFNGTHFVATADMAGTATLTSSTTSIAVSFAHNYIGTTAPVVNVTPTSNPGAFYWVTVQGSAGAWTGFTINIASAPGSNVVFNYRVDGQL